MRRRSRRTRGMRRRIHRASSRSRRRRGHRLSRIVHVSRGGIRL